MGSGNGMGEGLNRYSENTHRMRGFVQSNYDSIVEWPHQGAFTASAVDDTTAGLLEKAERLGLVERWGTIKEHGDAADLIVWSVTESLTDLIEDCAHPDAYKLPCGHTGFVNDRDSQYLRCKECNGRFTQKEVERGRGDE